MVHWKRCGSFLSFLFFLVLWLKLNGQENDREESLPNSFQETVNRWILWKEKDGWHDFFVHKVSNLKNSIIGTGIQISKIQSFHFLNLYFLLSSSSLLIKCQRKNKIKLIRAERKERKIKNKMKTAWIIDSRKSCG